MRIMMLLVIASSMMILAAPALGGSTDCKEPCQAVVTEVKGTCHVLQDDKGKKKKIAVGDCLLADQELQCDKSAHIKFKFCVTGEEKLIKESYLIPKLTGSVLGHPSGRWSYIIPKVAPLAIKDQEGPMGERPIGNWAQSQPRSEDAMKTQMDCIMARDRKTLEQMWQATRQGDAKKLQSFVQAGKAIMVPRGTPCVVLRAIDKDYVAVTVSGREGEWVTIKKVLVGFQ